MMRNNQSELSIAVSATQRTAGEIKADNAVLYNTRLIKSVLIFVLFLLTHYTGYGQSGQIKGTVTNGLSNIPLQGVTVKLSGQDIGTTTDSLGNYMIELKPGNYGLLFSKIGFKTRSSLDIQVSNVKPSVIDVGLDEDIASLNEVKITASSRTNKTLESPLSLRSIGVAEIKRNPGGNRDISKVVQSLPGVSSPVSFRNDIIIRGGAPNENRFYLDGVEIPNINHFSTQGSSGGPVGMINVDFIKEVNFYSGAFPANRGNTLSSVFEFNQKNGRSDRLGGTLTLGSSDLGATLEGPIGSKTTYWVFSGNDFDLKISAKENPGMLVLANDPNTQNINSACYSIIINRLTKLINTKGNLPSALIVDEVPTLFVHRVENLIATARSNKVAVLMGLQELPQFNQQYGKDTAATITAVVGTVLSGSVRNKETLEWLERLFGKSKQIGEGLSIDRNKTSTSLNEKLEVLIPAGKIASLNAGEMVGVIAADAQEKYTGQFETSAVNCRINLDMEEIRREEKGYRPLPAFYDFGGKLDEKLRQNFNHISQEIQEMVLAFKATAQPVPSKGTFKPNKP